MNEIAIRIWDGCPSIQPLVVSQADLTSRQAIVLPEAETSSLVQCIHKACFANATAKDSADATAHLSISKALSFAQFRAFLDEVVVQKWVDASIRAAPAITQSAAPSPTKSTTGGDDEVIVVPLTPVEEQLKAIADSILDDREPYSLLPYDSVLTVPNKPLSIQSPFSEFITLKQYRKHAPIYYRMWCHLVKKDPHTVTDHDLEATTITMDSFKEWFSFMYRLQVENHTPRRAKEAAKEDWYLALSGTGGLMHFTQFIVACKSFATRYGKSDKAEAYFTAILDHAEAVISKESNVTDFFSYKLRSCPSIPKKTLLVYAKQIHRLDDLDADRCEEEYFQQSCQNRILLLGPHRVGKSTLARELAKQINAKYVDIVQAAVEEVDAANNAKSGVVSEIATEIMDCIREDRKVPLHIRAALAAKVLAHPSTQHLGYVFDDIPTSDAKQLDNYFKHSTLLNYKPQAIVVMEATEGVVSEFAMRVVKEREEKRSEVLRQRQEEQQAFEAKAAHKAAKEAKKLAKALKAERKEKIAAGEIQATEEDNVVAEEEEPEEEEAPELDEEGNPLEPEAIVARDKLRETQRQRRMLLEDIEYSLLSDFPPHSNAPDCLALPSLAETVDFCTARRRVVEIGAISTAKQNTEYLRKRLALDVSTAPVEPTLTEDVPENPDGSADNDIPIAEAKLRILTEGTNLSFSKWKKYCPVTYYDDHVLVEGSMAFSVSYRGRIYCFTSRAKLTRFKDSPHGFLRQRIESVGPVLVLKRGLEVFGKSPQLKEEVLEAQIAESLGLTVFGFRKFSTTWENQRNLAKTRDETQKARAAVDAKQRLAREERLKKRLEAEAKKKKKDVDKKKPADKNAKKKEEEVTQEEAPPADEGAPQEVVIVETTADRLDKVIAQEVRKRESHCPLLVSLLSELDEGLFNTLFDERCLPPTVLVLDYVEPRPEGDEDAPVEEDEAEEVVDEEPEELDEDGNPKPKPPPKVKVVDLTDDKQYRRLIKKILGKFQTSTESSGSEPEPPAEGQPPVKPFQAFNVITMNVWSKSSEDLISDAVLALNPCAVNALPPQDGEDFTQDPEPEEGDTTNPILIPGPKAIHQFGASLKFCPVTLRDKGTLVTGDPTYWMSYKGKKYVFASQDALNTFKINAPRYTTDLNVSVPPRLWIVGVPFAGKKTLLAMLTAEFSLPVFDFDTAFLESIIAATQSDSGDNVRDLFIPSAKDNKFAKRAFALSQELKNFEKDQTERIALKEQTQAEQTAREEKRDAGEEVEDLDEDEEAAIQKALEFEPEEAEAKEERIAKTMRQIAAALTRVEPFESSGYVMIGRPNSEVELQALLDEGAYPDAVLHVKVTSETFVLRQLNTVFQTRKAIQEQKQAEVTEKKKQIQRKAREIELRKWRRRNIGADDVNEEELEEAPEDVEVVTLEGVRTDLEAQYENEFGQVSTVFGALPDRRVVGLELNGDGGKEQLLRNAREQLQRFLQCRRSLFCAVQVCTFDDAISMANNGVKMMSAFRFVDPVALSDERDGKPLQLREKAAGSVEEKEDLIPDEAPAAPKEKKMRKVTKTNEDGEEIEVEEEEQDEEAPPPEEPEPEEPLEPEPELSPEELEDMRKEHQDKMAALANKLKMKAAILGHRLYFFENNTTLLRFIANPLKYWDQPPPMPEISGPLFAVLEATPAPKGNKKPRGMGEHVALNCGSVFINFPKLLQWALLHKSLGSLYDKAKEALVQGKPLNGATVAQILVNRLRAADVRIKGATVQNLPRDAEQLELLTKEKVYFSKCFSFGDVLSNVVSAFRHISAITHAVQGEPHTMSSLQEVVHAVKLSTSKQKELLLRRAYGFPASINHTPTLEATILKNRSRYLWYCPFKWSRYEQLVEVPTDRTFAVEYHDLFYTFSCKEFFEEFLVRPETVSGETLDDGVVQKKLELPKILPSHLTAEQAAKVTLELAGCCPVTLFTTRHNVGLRGVTEPTAVLGNARTLVAEYDGKYYAMLNSECMTSFLRQPWVFAKHAVLPAPEKLPFDEKTLSTVPESIYITRTLREATSRAMLALCRVRPKYPGLTAEESALKFMALFLKAHNPKNNPVAAQQYKANFDKYSKEAVLYQHITTAAPTDDPTGDKLKEFHELCSAWDNVQDSPDAFKGYIHLKCDHEATM